MGDISFSQWYCKQCSGHDQVDELPPERGTECDERERDEPRPGGDATRPRVKLPHSSTSWQPGTTDRMMEDTYAYGWKNGHYRGKK